MPESINLLEASAVAASAIACWALGLMEQAPRRARLRDEQASAMQQSCRRGWIGTSLPN